MIIDEVKIKVTAGRGGDGLAVFNKIKMALGPTGGSGGRGGSIYIEGVSDLNALKQFRFKKDIKADDGENGKIKLNDGKDAKDTIIFAPVGTVIKNLSTGNVFEIVKIGQREVLAKGGRGGKGNYLFRSAINTSPKHFEKGKLGQEFEFILELKMIADVGFVGLPNVGKSSLLNELCNTKSKVANYAFTTLEPNLGAYYDLILADIPGLIEGASEGRGLGIKFLKHIERTGALFHFICAESENPVNDYNIIRNELGVYNEILLQKTEYIFLSKSDMYNSEKISQVIKDFENIDKKIIPISIIDTDSLQKVKQILNKILDQKII